MVRRTLARPPLLHQRRRHLLVGIAARNHRASVSAPFLTHSVSAANPPKETLRRHIHGSAAHTLLWLSAALALCFVISRLLPGVEAENEAARYQIKPNVLLVNEAAADTNPNISAALYQNWKTTRQRFFQELAFYRVSRETAEAGSAPMPWYVAHSTRNLFRLLGLPINFAERSEDADGSLPAVILSYDTWMRSFAGDPHIAGHVLRIGHNRARIAGVAPAGGWQLPGAPDAWLLESDTQIASGSAFRTNGYLFAQLSARGQAAMSGPGISISARNQDGTEIDLYGAFIVAPVEGPWGIYEFALFLALIALPAVTSVSLGDSHVSSHRPSMKQRFNRVLFLCAKFLLVAAIGFAASLDLAYGKHHRLFAAGRVHATPLVLHHLSLRIPLGGRRSAQKMPSLPAPRHQPRHRRPGFAHLPRLERHRDDLHGRARPAPRSITAHQLVQRPTLALSRQLLGIPLRRLLRLLRKAPPNQPTVILSNA